MDTSFCHIRILLVASWNFCTTDFSAIILNSSLFWVHFSGTVRVYLGRLVSLLHRWNKRSKYGWFLMPLFFKYTLSACTFVYSNLNSISPLFRRMISYHGQQLPWNTSLNHFYGKKIWFLPDLVLFSLLCFYLSLSRWVFL